MAIASSPGVGRARESTLDAAGHGQLVVAHEELFRQPQAQVLIDDPVELVSGARSVRLAAVLSTSRPGCSRSTSRRSREVLMRSISRL